MIAAFEAFKAPDAKFDIKFQLERGKCLRVKNNCSDSGGFRVMKVRVIENNLREFTGNFHRTSKIVKVRVTERGVIESLLY